MGEMHDAWFFIGIFVFIFLVWIATGGPMHPLSFSGPRLALPGPLGGGTYLSLPKAPFSIGESPTLFPTFGTTPLDTTTSSYKNVSYLSHTVSNAGSNDPAREYLQISVNASANVPVNLTGWVLASEATGNAATIPKGTALPTSGIVNDSENIVLTPGQRAILISGRSPIGASFRENKCIGYFDNYQKFYPELPLYCPTPTSDLATFYGGAGYIRDVACIDYVNTIPRCTTSLTPPVSLSGSCQSFIIKYLNYNGCVEAHKNDPDFEGNTWRIYLGRTAPLWRPRYEVVKLMDNRGQLVDQFSY